MQIPPVSKTDIKHEPDLDALSILVVDDEPAIRETLKAYLGHLGIEDVQTAQNGKLALESLATSHYDYVFMDLMMPEMGGMEVLESLSRNAKPSSVIVMTGYPSLEKVIEAMQSERYDFIVVNFANGDMVGHTAIRDAIIKAVEALDLEVGRVIEAAIANDYAVVLTADHGNCDEMVDPETGKPHTQHSYHPVPCLVIDSDVQSLLPDGDLSAIAPTVLQLMGVPQPAAMSGRSVISGSHRRPINSEAGARPPSR